MPFDLRERPSSEQSAARPLDLEPDPLGYTALFNVLDRAWHASMARYTLGISPRAVASAYLDWMGGLAFSPGKQAALTHKAHRKWMRLLAYAGAALYSGDEAVEPCIDPLPQDRRFDDPAWRTAPFNVIQQSFLLTQQWWHNATTAVSGMTPADERAITFAARQWLDLCSPSNFLLTNPVALRTTWDEHGDNLVRGWRRWAEDAQNAFAGRAADQVSSFVVGRDVATTPGRVIYRNRLIELIQYAPTTADVYAEPVLITPAWIMKYYVLDLSPHNSLVKHLVDSGRTVFMISWKNPGEEDRELSLDDYRRLGPMAALDAIGKATGAKRVHGVGYCLGGTLLAIAAAAMARDNDERFASLTFLAAQVDFEEAGELMLFINEKEVAFLEDLMWEQGFLDSTQMAGAFQLLRSNDLVWSRLVNDYLLGRPRKVSDMEAWNADGTRMPYRMHSEYLRQLFLENDLAEGRYVVDGDRIALSDIRAPAFVVGTQTDHIAPWRSVFKLQEMIDSEVTFVLTNGGHNAGVVADPADAWRAYQIDVRRRGAHVIEPDRWAAKAPRRQGSWWQDWIAWLDAQPSSERAAPPFPPPETRSLCDAPGTYVHMR